jgi:hypothetical protein
VALADAGRSDQEHVLVEGDETGGREFGELGPGDLGVEGPVKVLDLLDLDDLGPPEAAGEEAVSSAVELVLDEELEELEVRQRGAGRLGEPSGECLGHAGQSQMS